MNLPESLSAGAIAASLSERLSVAAYSSTVKATQYASHIHTAMLRVRVNCNPKAAKDIV
jgi:hypothetical protein